MFIFLFILSSIVFSLFYYVQAVKYAMNKKRWLVGGLCFGPILLPMFSISKNMKLRQARGFNNLYWLA